MFNVSRTRTPAAVIEGLGAWLPERAVPNAELCATLDTTDEWIRSRTGIENRYVAPAGTSTSDIAIEAGRLAMKSAGTTEVDLVLLATTTPDQSCPATAPTVSARLGLNGRPAFDVAAVCSGFVYGLANASGLLLGGLAERVLLIAADTFSTIVDPADRATAIIFGDGAGAVVLRTGFSDELGALTGFDLGSDGEHAHVVGVPAGGSRQRSAGTLALPHEHFLVMDGRTLYKHAIKRMSDSCHLVLDRTGLTTSDVDLLVPHQANVRITEGVLAKLGLQPQRGFSNIDRMGNTAVASVPIALADAAQAGRLRPGHRVLSTAFGAGLTWGSVTFTWPDIVPLHNLPPAPVTKEKAMFDKLKEILVKKFSVAESDVKEEATLEDLGLTSLDLVEFADIVSTQFNVNISDDEVVELERVGKIVALVAKRLPSTA
jgi:3-oxoacyl-[acyl-carrier-protein] synthase-3